MTDLTELCDDGIPLQYPQLEKKRKPSKPALPKHWQCKALLHPFAPPDSTHRQKGPFFEFCVARIECCTDEWLSVRLRCADGGSVWFRTVNISGECRTIRSDDSGTTWRGADLNWRVPDFHWLDHHDCEYVGSGPLNWMNDDLLDWWKFPLGADESKHSDIARACWCWIHARGPDKGLAYRMMFGAPPADLLRGELDRPALFQMFSFSYLFDYSFEPLEEPPAQWRWPEIQGLDINPAGLKPVVWEAQFGMTAMMTSCRYSYNPIPTQVLYRWLPEGRYPEIKVLRAQRTLMQMCFNRDKPYRTQTDLLYGPGPDDSPAGVGYLVSENWDHDKTCVQLKADGVAIGQQPPNWMSACDGKRPLAKIVASISGNPCLGHDLIIYSVLFPPTTTYPQGRYLWTWYSKDDPSGSRGRPVTFMESASDVAEGGTGLALADYFDYRMFVAPDWAFDLPKCCEKADSA